MDTDKARIDALAARMERFASGQDCSLAAANVIEGEIAIIFPEDDELQELAEDLAQYQPEGGDHLYSEADLRPRMIKWCEAVQRRFGACRSETGPT